MIGSSPSKEQLGGIRDPLLLETTVFFALLLLQKQNNLAKSIDADHSVSLALALLPFAGGAVAVSLRLCCDSVANCAEMMLCLLRSCCDQAAIML